VCVIWVIWFICRKRSTSTARFWITRAAGTWFWRRSGPWWTWPSPHPCRTNPSIRHHCTLSPPCLLRYVTHVYMPV